MQLYLSELHKEKMVSHGTFSQYVNQPVSFQPPSSFEKGLSHRNQAFNMAAIAVKNHL